MNANRFVAVIDGQKGPNRKTPLGALKAAIKQVNPSGPTRADILEDGCSLLIVHGANREEMIIEAQDMLISNKRRYK